MTKKKSRWIQTDKKFPKIRRCKNGGYIGCFSLPGYDLWLWELPNKERRTLVGEVVLLCITEANKTMRETVISADLWRVVEDAIARERRCKAAAALAPLVEHGEKA